MQFGKEVLDLIEVMKQTKHGQPELPVTLPTAFHTFTSLPWAGDEDIWSFVDIPQLFNYLRKARGLHIPTEWKAVVPKSMT